MTIEPLHCRDLQPGDIMLKFTTKGEMQNWNFAKNITSRVIFSLQTASFKENRQVVHAGVMFDKTYIIEAQKCGISANDLRVQNKDCSYAVYKCNNSNIAQGAGTCAKMMFDINKNPSNRRPMRYNLLGALASLRKSGSGNARTSVSMDDLLTDILAGKSHPFFCSQFVIYVYQFVAVQNGFLPYTIFRGNDAKVPPSTLMDNLITNPQFTRKGFMLKGIR
jgi:hypothetical protein